MNYIISTYRTKPTTYIVILVDHICSSSQMHGNRLLHPSCRMHAKPCFIHAWQTRRAQYSICVLDLLFKSISFTFVTRGTGTFSLFLRPPAKLKIQRESIRTAHVVMIVVKVECTRFHHTQAFSLTRVKVGQGFLTTTEQLGS